MKKRKLPYGLLPDWAIREYVKIEPFADCEPRPGKISFGTSSYGYDIRLGTKFKLFSPITAQSNEQAIVDPKNVDESSFVTIVGDSCVIPANHYVIGESLEYMEVPRDVTVVCIGKSTYARVGVIANVTPLEAAWKGKVTLEISNSSPLPVRVYAMEGICQLLFLRAEAACDVSYADKKGIYQDQQGLTLAKVR